MPASRAPTPALRRWSWHALLGALLIALAASAAAAVEQYGEGQTFCRPGGGCDAVRTSDVGRTLAGVLPGLGLLGYTAIVLGLLWGGTRTQRAALAGATTGALAALGLIAMQFAVIGRVCGLCMVADGAALIAGGFAARRLFGPSEPLQVTPSARRVSLALLVVAGLGPPAWAASTPARVPPYVRALEAEHPGVVTVVELSDFQCPYCRALHPVLGAALAPYGARATLVRKSIPLPGHRFAFGAAQAFVCAQAQDRGEAMADRLFTTDALDAQALRDHAREISLDVASFERCMTDPATARLVASDVDLVRTEGLSGLPTVYIAGERFVGFNPDKSGERYAAALERAARGQAPAPRPLPMLGVAALAALLIAWPTRRKADAGPALNRAT